MVFQTPVKPEDNAPIITATEAASALPDSSLNNFLILFILKSSIYYSERKRN